MSDPALPPNPTEGPPTTPINPFAPSGSMLAAAAARKPSSSFNFGPNPTAPTFVSAQKRQRSDTISPILPIKDEIVRKFPRSDYWTLRAAQAITEAGVDLTEFCSTDSHSRLILGFLTEIQKDYTTRTDLLFSQIDIHNKEILDLKLQAKESPPSPSPTPKPVSTSAPPPPASTSKPPPAIPPPTWATVAKRNKKKMSPSTANTQAPPTSAPNTNKSSPTQE